MSAEMRELRVYGRINERRKEQDEKWGSIVDLDHSPEKWLAILVEEVGEVAKALLEREDGARVFDRLLEDEIVDVVASGVSWLEAIDVARQRRIG